MASPGNRVPAAPRICSGLYNSGIRVEPYHRWRGWITPGGLHLDLVPARCQVRSHFGADSVLEVEYARIEAMIIKRTHQVQCLKPWGLNRFLHIHSEFDDVEYNLDKRLILIVSARC